MTTGSSPRKTRKNSSAPEARLHRRRPVQDEGADSQEPVAFHLDVGHSSIGWAVTGRDSDAPFKGVGVVLFQADTSLASARRANRRQRRHIRSTRRRIERMHALLAHIGVLSPEELARPGCAYPWKLAAEALSGGKQLTWRELWDVLRWYAHNRGYDGNALWRQGREEPEDAETRDSCEKSHSLMAEHGTSTMCETVCALLDVPPGGERKASMLGFKTAKASFPRSVVESEVRRILERHLGLLPGLDAALIRSLLGNPLDDPQAWQATTCPSIRLPRRYWGGLLFGQLAPRFDNRIIGTCPVSDEKRPLKECPEFLEFRWASFMSNLRVFDTPAGRPLSRQERQELTKRIRAGGYFTRSELKKALTELTGVNHINVDAMLIVQDADEALVLYPGLKALDSAPFAPLLDASQKRMVLKQLQRKGSVRYSSIREGLPDGQKRLFDEALAEANAGKRKAKNEASCLTVKFPAGRAPYSRNVMRQAVAEIMDGKDPRMEGGCLYRNAVETDRLAADDLDRTTNNHLVRHRLRILDRLLHDLTEAYSGGDAQRVEAVTIEVNRDIKDLSGKTVKEIAAEMGLRLASHRKAVARIQKDLGLEDQTIGGSFIRKARIAMDLGFKCPYTGKLYDIKHVESKDVDLDHVVPRSARQTDSLDALVLTYKEVNAWKGARTALQFVRDEQGKPVPGKPELSIVGEADYRKFVDGLKPNGGHDDDRRRNRNRKRNMLMLHAAEAAGFTPGDLTRTSYLVTLAACLIRDRFAEASVQPRILSLPGRITKEVRVAWQLMGLLARVNPGVLDDQGRLRTKTEIRDISHLHHAVDAAVLALAATRIPSNGRIWSLLAQRRHSDEEVRELVSTGCFLADSRNHARLRDLPERVMQNLQCCLAESRVVIHVPARKRGVYLTQNPVRLVSVDREKQTATLRKWPRDPETGIRKPKDETVKTLKLLGLQPAGTSKLAAIKGVLEVNSNFGVALDPAPAVIPFHKVWCRIGAIKKQNGGRLPRIVRNGQLIEMPQGRYKGLWRVCSVKNAEDKILVDIARPDVVKPRSKMDGAVINASLTTLVKDGLRLVDHSLTGVSLCPTMSSTSAVRSARSPAGIGS